MQETERRGRGHASCATMTNFSNVDQWEVFCTCRGLHKRFGLPFPGSLGSVAKAFPRRGAVAGREGTLPQSLFAGSGSRLLVSRIQLVLRTQNSAPT
jgi:hypothetical protein